MEKKTIGVLFGGRSTEHDISCISAANIIRLIDKQKYNIVLIGITTDGRFVLTDSVEEVEDGSWADGGKSAILVPDAGIHGAIIIEDGRTRTARLDAVIPALHGLYGEDGTVQGVLELAKIPYVGCGVVSSAVSMDKHFTKIVAADCGIAQAGYISAVPSHTGIEDIISEVDSKLKYPVFVKPANAGSSFGITKVQQKQDLESAIKKAVSVDQKIIIEQAIVGRELECALFSAGGDIRVSGVGEILSAGVFYDYDAKYNNSESKTVINPILPNGKEDEIREAAKKIFMAVDGYGLARADFFLEQGTDRVIFNEINTFPGFTSISMYPMLWSAAGVSAQKLVDDLIQSAFKRGEA